MLLLKVIPLSNDTGRGAWMIISRKGTYNVAAILEYSCERDFG
jgi:hypothetical protein